MNRRGTGVVFCLIAALLFSARFISAAIWGSGVTTWSGEIFDAMYNNIGNRLTIASAISLIVGIVYLVWAEIKNDNSK